MRFYQALLFILAVSASLFAAPAIAIDNPSNGAIFNTPAEASVIYGYSSDVGPTTAICTVWVDGVDFNTHEMESGSSAQINLDALNYGGHTMYISCSEPGAPSTFITTPTRSFYIGTPPGSTPTVTAVSPSGAQASGDLEFSFIYSSNGGPNAAQCTVMVDGTDKTPSVIATDSNGNPARVTINGIAPGQHTWNVRCDYSDPRFPIYGSTANYFYVPQANAAVTLISPSDGYSTTTVVSDFVFKYEAGSNGLQNAKCDLYFDASPTPTFTRYVNSGETVNTGVLGAFSGRHSWQVVCGGSIASPVWNFEVVQNQPQLVLNSPSNGATLGSGSIDFTYTYTANSGPNPTNCSMTLDGAVVDPSAQVNSGSPRTVAQSVTVPGQHTWSVACYVNGIMGGGGSVNVVSSSQFSIIGAPSVTLVSPSNGAVFAPSAIDLVYTYDAFGAQTPALCNLYVDSNIAASRMSDSGKSYALASSATGVLGSHAWYVQCIDSANAIIATSGNRSFTVAASNGGGGGGSGGSGTGSSGGSGGTGGGSLSTPRPAPKRVEAATGTQLAGGLINATRNVSEEQPIRARLAAPETKSVNDSVQLILKDEEGRPLSAVDIYVHVGNLSKRLTTDSLGRASFIATKMGTYTYLLGKGYVLVNEPQTVVTQAMPNTQAAMSGINWGDLVNYALIFIGLLALLAIIGSAYFMVTRKKGEEDEGLAAEGERPPTFN